MCLVDSWSNFPLTSHKSEPSHKDCLSQSINKVVAQCNSQLLFTLILNLFSLLADMVTHFTSTQGNKLLYEEDKQADAYTLFQCFTPPTLSAVQALKLCGPDKLISASYDDSYVCIILNRNFSKNPI